METPLLLGTVAVTLLLVATVLLLVRRALDHLELTLRGLVTGLRIAARAAGSVPGAAARIGTDAVAGRAELDRLSELKVPPARRRRSRR